MPGSTDAHAVSRTFTDKDCIPHLPYNDTQFGLVGTDGSLSYWHVDPRGDVTWVTVLAGAKAWHLAFPKDPKYAASILRWTADEIDVRKLDYEKYDIVTVLLRPGTIL